MSEPQKINESEWMRPSPGQRLKAKSEQMMKDGKMKPLIEIFGEKAE